MAVLICALFSYIAAFTHFIMVDRHAAFNIEQDHDKVLSGDADSPMQYRPGAYLVAEGFRKAFDRFLDAEAFRKAFGGFLTGAYFFERMLFCFTAGFVIFLFFRRFLTTGWALAGVGWFYAILPFTYQGYWLQPGDPINATFYALAYLASASGLPLWIIPTVGIGALFRETVILLPVFNLMIEYGKRPLGGSILRCIVGIIAAIVIIYAIQSIYGPRPHPDPWIMVGNNLKDSWRWIWGLIVLIGLPTALAIWGWRGLGAFHKRGLLFAAMFLIIHFIFGRFGETRLYLPVLPLFILAALNGLKYQLGNKTEK